MTEKQLANPQAPTALKNISSYMLSTEVKARFEEMMGKGASYYLNQVMIIVANSERLQQCTVQSIFLAAMRAATLRLSVDPGQGQAWIIPYSNRATFQLGYRGVYELALRTNLYRFINVIDIFEGEELVENRMTGMHAIAGKPISTKKVAYMLYFKLLNGFEKTFVMTIPEIEQHAQIYNPKAYNDPDSPWNSKNGREREKMLKKTVLSNGLNKWGRFNQGDLEILNQIEDEQGWNEAEVLDPDLLPPSKQKPSQEQLMSELGFSDQPQSPTPATPQQPPLPTGTELEMTLPNYRRANWPKDAKVSLEMAEKIKASEKPYTPYLELTISDLKFRITGLSKALKENGINQDNRDEIMLKRDVAQIIIAIGEMK